MGFFSDFVTVLVKTGLLFARLSFESVGYRGEKLHALVILSKIKD